MSFIDHLSVVVSAVVLAIGLLTHPTSARCPKDWWLRTGIRPSGVFICEPLPVGGEEGSDGDGYIPPGFIHARIYCGDRHPVTHRDFVTVSCAR